MRWTEPLPFRRGSAREPAKASRREPPNSGARTLRSLSVALPTAITECHGISCGNRRIQVTLVKAAGTSLERLYRGIDQRQRRVARGAEPR